MAKLPDDPLFIYDEKYEDAGFRLSQVRYDPADKHVHVELVCGLQISFPRERTRWMRSASDEELDKVEISGLMAYFPKLDEGFSLEPLAHGDFGNHPWDDDFVELHGRHLKAA